eukprot:TRINITY_DN18043_c0_g1_i1.p1 TRINITY_DN18043_c0_g1~~TRINITY_DN18043_c0_g1_i1.p1  ORF type:complete len:118 (-),score=7.30 TRINITY_DN18043_c0_g1_i1:241-594(-)
MNARFFWAESRRKLLNLSSYFLVIFIQHKLDFTELYNSMYAFSFSLCSHFFWQDQFHVLFFLFSPRLLTSIINAPYIRGTGSKVVYYTLLESGMRGPHNRSHLLLIQTAKIELHPLQ